MDIAPLIALNVFLIQYGTGFISAIIYNCLSHFHKQGKFKIDFSLSKKMILNKLSKWEIGFTIAPIFNLFFIKELIKKSWKKNF